MRPKLREWDEEDFHTGKLQTGDSDWTVVIEYAEDGRTIIGYYKAEEFDIQDDWTITRKTVTDAS